MLTTTPTAEDYARIFEQERAVQYLAVDDFERRMGYACDHLMLEEAARVLACPMKVNRPNWQHGRVLYALASRYALSQPEPCPHLRFLDIGTAKGFSALCLQWALAECNGEVFSIDVIDPYARVRRNTVAEVDGWKTLSEILAPWPESMAILFEQATGVDWLRKHHERVHVAFVDGKHDYNVVLTEGKLLADRQESGDIVMFDDVQIPAVAKAVKQLDPYECEYLDLGVVNRQYAIGTRR